MTSPRPETPEDPTHAGPDKGRTGVARIWNALLYSMAGLKAAWRHEAAFRQEAWLALLLIPLSLFLPASGIGSAAVFIALLNVVATWGLVLFA